MGVSLLLLCALGLVASCAHRGMPTFPASVTLPRARHAGGRDALPDRVPIVSRTTAFAASACIAYRPLRGNRRRTVFVDAGHGGPDPGAVGTTSAGAVVDEKDVTLATARDLLAILRDAGYRVVLARTGDTPVARLAPADLCDGALTAAGEHRDIAARIACANAAGANLLVSIHFDTFGDPTVGGAETLYDSARPFSATNHRLATLAQQDIVASLDAAGWAVPDRGAIDDTEGGTPALTREGATYGRLLELGPAAPGWLDQPSAMPGVLCEPLFLSEPTEADIAALVGGSGRSRVGWPVQSTPSSHRERRQGHTPCPHLSSTCHAHIMERSGRSPMIG